MDKKYSADDIILVKKDRSYDDLIDLTKDGFEKNLVLAVSRALEFARTLVVNELPDEVCHMVLLNASYDAYPLGEDEKVFDEINVKRKFTDTNAVAELLWRDGMVPEWVNVSVVSEAEGFTNIELVCCGRFTNNLQNIYHAKEGIAPFHVLGPPIPDKFELGSGEKFKL